MRTPLIKRWTGDDLAELHRIDAAIGAAHRHLRQERIKATIRPVTPNRDALKGRNAASAAAAAARDVAAARRVLAAGGLTDEQELILQVRVDHPTESMAMLAAQCGISKSTYRGRLNTALRAATPSSAHASEA